MRFERIRKSSFIRNTEVAVAIIAFLITAWLLQHRINKMIVPSCKFIKGRGQAIKIENADKSINRLTRYVYSFEADYNDVCASAHSELKALGYAETPPSRLKSRSREYRLPGPRPGDWISVTILDKHRFEVYSTPRHSKYSSPNQYTYHYKDGWVSVNITQSQRYRHSQGDRRQGWLRYRFKLWLRRLFP